MPNSTLTDGPTGLASQLASLQVQIGSSSTVIIFCVIVTLIWGYLWSGIIRDEEHQRLPSSFAARMFFAFSLGAVYIGLVIVGFLAPEILQNLKMPGLGNLLDAVRTQVPLLALVLMGAMYSIPQLKELAERYAILLHNAQYRRADENVLQRHLQNCDFNPSENEITQNIDYVRQFDVYVTDHDRTGLNLETVGSWRKVSSLLRMLEAEGRGRNTVLSEAERDQVARLAEAHKRKTQLAMNIIRMIEQIDVNSNVDQKLTRLASQLSDVPHSDRERVVSSEETARQIVSQLDRKSAHADMERPLRLSMRQMNEYLGQIERYFMTEYQLILREIAGLTAKMIIRAGDRAADRLESVKAAGFAGLGHIERVSFDSVLWVVLSSFTIAFGGLTLLVTMMGRNFNSSAIAAIALTLSVATLIGAMWGSRRSLSERQATPWSSYMGAGLLAVGAFCAIHAVRFLIGGQDMLARMAASYGRTVPHYVDLKLLTPEQAQYYAPENVLKWDVFDYLWQSLPWSVSVFFLTVGICWLARLPQWPWQKGNPIIERLSDGLAAGIIYSVGGIGSVIAHIAFRTGSGLRALEKLQNPASGAHEVFLGEFRLVGFLIGFAIGAIIVREVRRIAHAQLIAPADRREKQPEALPQERVAAISLDARQAS